MNDGGGGRVRSAPTLSIPLQEIQFEEPLDRGAFGEVFRGYWRGNEVAIKVCLY